MKKQLEEILNDLTEYLKENKPKYLYNQNFIPGKSQVLYSGPFWDEKEIMSGVKSLVDGKWLVGGENTHKFQRDFSKLFNVKFSQAVNSGSSANLILITGLKKYFNWSDGDEIIVSPVGFPTTISPIVQNNLTPVFIDIEYETLNFDITKIEEKITSKTRAIFVSPVLGNPPDLDFLKELCDKYDLKLIGDSCDSIGSKWDGKDISEYYIGWTTSFYPAHHMTICQGGMVNTDIEELYKLFYSLSTWGRNCTCLGTANLLSCGSCGNRFDKWLDLYDGKIDHKYYFTSIGYNLLVPDVLSSIGLEQIKKFPEIDKKRKISKNIIENILLKYVSGIRGVKMLDKADTCWFGTPFICNSKEIKQKLVTFLEGNKIQTRNYFAGSILLHPAYQHLDDYKKYPNANQVLDNVFFIGCAPNYDEQVFNYVENIFKENWIN